MAYKVIDNTIIGLRYLLRKDGTQVLQMENPYALYPDKMPHTGHRGFSVATGGGTEWTDVPTVMERDLEDE